MVFIGEWSMAVPGRDLSPLDIFQFLKLASASSFSITELIIPQGRWYSIHSVMQGCIFGFCEISR